MRFPVRKYPPPFLLSVILTWRRVGSVIHQLPVITVTSTTEIVLSMAREDDLRCGASVAYDIT